MVSAAQRTTSTATARTETIREVTALIPRPIALQGKASYTVYREHDGVAEARPNSGDAVTAETSTHGKVTASRITPTTALLLP